MDYTRQSIERVKAMFRFLGDGVDPSTITSRLSVQPTDAFAKGDPVAKHPERIRHTGMWGLESSLPQECSVDEHLNHLLDVLESHACAIRSLHDTGLYADFFCGWFHEGDDFMPMIKLGAGTLARIATLGVPLELHLYKD